MHRFLRLDFVAIAKPRKERTTILEYSASLSTAVVSPAHVIKYNTSLCHHVISPGFPCTFLLYHTFPLLTPYVHSWFDHTNKIGQYFQLNTLTYRPVFEDGQDYGTQRRCAAGNVYQIHQQHSRNGRTTWVNWDGISKDRVKWEGNRCESYALRLEFVRMSAPWRHSNRIIVPSCGRKRETTKWSLSPNQMMQENHHYVSCRSKANTA